TAGTRKACIRFLSGISVFFVRVFCVPTFPKKSGGFCAQTPMVAAGNRQPFFRHRGADLHSKRTSSRKRSGRCFSCLLRIFLSWDPFVSVQTSQPTCKIHNVSRSQHGGFLLSFNSLVCPG